MASQSSDPLPNPNPPPPRPTSDPNAFNLALAVALLRSQKRRGPIPPPAKRRKRELIRLREELKLLEDERAGAANPPAPRVVSCRCHFFDGCGHGGVGDDAAPHWIDEVLRRRFLRYVRWDERRKKAEGSARRAWLTELNTEHEIDQLSTSVDFLVQLADTPDKTITSFACLSHLAIDFIVASMKSLLLSEKDHELVEEIINNLITRLTERMCSDSAEDGPSLDDSDCQFCIQHLIRKLAKEPYIGQHILLLVSQRICVLADNILSMDPFDDAFPNMHNSMFLMFQLIEFLVSDNIWLWMKSEDFDTRLLEEWLRSILQARKNCKLLECRHGLYIIYIERIAGQLAKHLASLSQEGKIDVDILSSLFCAL